MRKNFKLEFIGIGAYKSGTTWLTQCLREHPDVCIPRIKELDYFSKKYIDGRFVYSHFDKGIGWYKKQFNECDNRASCWGEFSNSYLSDKDTPELIGNIFPDIKLLLCIRNPIDRAYSEYLWDKLNFTRGKYKGVFMKEIKSGDYVEHGLYGKYIKNYLKVFNRKNIHVILYNDILQRPQDVMDELCSFLNLELFSPPSLKKIVNPASEARNRLFTYVFDLRIKIEEKKLGVIIDIMKRLRLYNFIQNVYVWINRKPIKKKPLTKKQKAELKGLFLNDILLTEGLLDIDLSAWK